MEIYRYRVILDNDKNVFRDIEIHRDATLEEFHNAIVNAFGFDGMQMASFYQSNDDWAQGQEYSLFDMFDEEEKNLDTGRMSAFKLSEVCSNAGDKMLYIYDFFNMWTFYVELVKTLEPDPGHEYPRLVLVLGSMPDSKEEIQFQSDHDNGLGEGAEYEEEDEEDGGFDEDDDWN